MSKIILKVNGIQYEVKGEFGPDVSLNEYIRNVLDLRGTKAMCHEGGCGACIVAVTAAVPPTKVMKTFSVNSCLVSILSCHGWEITTVEGVGNRIIGYHDTQIRLAKFNGTQCGYCTPGWIMNMYSLYKSQRKGLSLLEIENSFAGNMCRCTGYRPIADAFKTFAKDVDKSLLDKLVDLEDLSRFKFCGVKCERKCAHKLQNKLNFHTSRQHCIEDEFNNIDNNGMILVDCGKYKWYKVFNLEDIYKAMDHGIYKLIAGNTGQGVYHVNDYPSNIIDIFNVQALKGYMIDVNLILGSGMSLTDMMDLFLEVSVKHDEFTYLKKFYDHMDLVAHIPVRNIGTIGGNLFLKHFNNSFQSDLFLLFETVGALLTIGQGVSKSNSMTLPEFLKTDMNGKIIINVILPPLSDCCSIKTYKVMPRSQNAHAIVNAGFLFRFNKKSTDLEYISIVYGGISPTFIRASKTEDILAGRDPFTDESLQIALKSLSSEINPTEAPPDPSAAYRKMLALALYYKAILSLCPSDRVDPKYRSGAEAIKRTTSQGMQSYDTDKSVWPINQPIPKLEALVQCSGEAVFANDLPAQKNEVFAAFVTADAPPGSIIESFNTTEAFQHPGVIAFYTAEDIPGDNCFTGTNMPYLKEKELILCEKCVMFYGQPAAIIVADREKTANKVASLVKVNYESQSKVKPLLTIEDVLQSSERRERIQTDSTVEPTDRGNDVKSIINGKFRIEGQYHYTMEPHTCVTKPTEDGMDVYAASQWLDLTNVAIAQCLKVPVNSINVIVRRLGGGYGAKISRINQAACAAAIVTHLSGKPCRFIMPLETMMKTIGKRTSTSCEFEIAINSEGEIQYLKNTFYENAGINYNEVLTPISLMHFQNCYESKRWYIQANNVITDCASNTWCRAPFSNEGIAMIEYIMEMIAFHVGEDPLQVRLKNMSFENNPIPELIYQLIKDADYDERSKLVKEFNVNNRWRKRGLKLIPISIDIFYLGNFNALISIYHADGTVVVTHGGTEMGQGINTKAAQVCAYALGIPLQKVSVKSSSSFTSPNCMFTGASVGSESVAFAIIKACEILNKRLEPVKAKLKNPSWEEIIAQAHEDGIDLQATYMFSNIRDDVKPYDVYAVGILEVEVDILTGNHDVLRVDILEDTGRSLNPEIDVAQIEGAFVMGLGYWTSEKLVYDINTGKLLTDRTWTYKPPGIKDIPADMRIYFRRNARNEFGVLQSKTTGEPAFCLATVIIHALREAVRSARLDAGYEDKWINIDNPCTAENIFMSIGHKIEHFKLK